MSLTGRIFDIQRFSIHDGPGIRTTVFLKGCPLRCKWCHNPEGLLPARQISFLPAKCIFCGECVKICKTGAHTLSPDDHELNREICIACGKCVESCHPRALEAIGRDATVEEVLADVLRDKPFYEHSGGGMTLSGGEPLVQIDFSDALLTAAKAEGLHCAVETCSYVDWASIDRVRDKVDLFLCDIKDTDPVKHRELAGVECDRIFENLRKLNATGANMQIRLPVVPGHNDRKDHFEGVAKFVKSLDNEVSVEVMPYHRLGVGKQRRLGVDESIETFEAASPDDVMIADWLTTLKELGVDVVNEMKK
jgi:pyruvate formate lyase activating enzyme